VCPAQACNFRDASDELSAQGEMCGVSGDSADSPKRGSAISTGAVLSPLRHERAIRKAYERVRFWARASRQYVIGPIAGSWVPSSTSYLRQATCEESCAARR